jgi:caa(3)-type oxidase subunit IV
MARRRIDRALWLRPVLAWLALLLLLGLTATVSFVPLGYFNFPISLCIAGVKAAIIGFIFMRLIEVSPLQCLAAMAGPTWIFIMFVLMASDYLTR